MNLDYFAHFCLKFGHITVVLPVVVFCIIFFKRDIFAKAACFLLWVMIFNTLLKRIFKVPLFPHLGSGYAFPSGHMHASAAFYGYILYRTDKTYVKYLLGALFGCIAFSLMYCHFHDLKDILGALFFAAAEIGIYHIIRKNYGDEMAGIIAFISAIVIIMVLNVIHKVEFHVWLAFYGLAGMELALSATKDVQLRSFTRKFLAFSVVILLMLAVYYFFKIMALDKFCISEIRFALIPLIIVGVKKIVAQKW